MSEAAVQYMNLEIALKQLEQRLHEVTTDPAASHWLKQAVRELWERDGVDALNDLEVLQELMKAKHQIDLLMVARMLEIGETQH